MISSNSCGDPIPCAVYFTNNPTDTNYTVIKTWSLTNQTKNISVAYTFAAVTANKGNLLLVAFTSATNQARISIDKTSNSTYCDLMLNASSNTWNRISTTSQNFRLFLNTTSSLNIFQARVSVSRAYIYPGSYFLKFISTQLGSNYTRLLQITDCNLRHLLEERILFLMIYFSS